MNVVLEPFTALPNRCRMCESDSIHTRWEEARGPCGKDGCTMCPPPLPERLEHRCNRCGYEWMTATAEKAVF